MALPNSRLGADNIRQILQGKKRLFFAGIGGVSMNALAHVSVLRGFDVAGYDRSRTSITEKLETLGIKVYYTPSADNMSDRDVLIYTVAMPPDTPEIVYAEEHGIPMISRSDYLGYLMLDYDKRIGVSGTHGKSTTTAMIGCILREAGKEPTVLNGAVMKETGTVDIIGKHDFLSFEACEYMDSFLDFNPNIAVVLNIELDHVDYFKSIEQIKNSFTEFINRAGEDGVAILNLNDKDCVEIAKRAKCKVISFAHENPLADYYSANETLVAGYPEFDIFRHGKKLARVRLSVPGEHNVSDALAAFAACVTAGADPEPAAKALSEYRGICRRMEKLGFTHSGAQLFSDYAHHPTEIQATLRGIRKVCNGKLTIIFQPHTFSRTYELFNNFAASLSSPEADEIILCDIYPARETNIYGVSSSQLSERIRKNGKKSTYFDEFEKAAEYAESVSGPDDIVMIMGAGDIIKIADLLLA